MLQMANTEIPTWTITTLQALGCTLTIDHDEATIFVSPPEAPLTAVECLKLAAAVASMRADEIEIEEDMLRLWWD